MLVSLGYLESTQAKASEQNYKDVMRILNYSAFHPITIFRYKVSDMIFRIHDDASYLYISRSRSWADGHHYLTNNSDNPPNNGAISTICKIPMNIMGSLSEAEIGSTYINDQNYITVRTCLIEMGDTQPPTKLQVYNTNVEEFSKGTPKKNTSKSKDIHFYWIQDRETQVQFNIFWRLGKVNLGDYHTKHH